MKTSRVLREGKEQVTFRFVCEGCGATGRLGIFKRDGMKPFGCPEGCGATYVPWKPANKWELKCVVKPMLAKEQP